MSQGAATDNESTAGPRPTGRTATVEAVVRVAAALLAEVGPHRLTVRAVAAEAGVNHALIHRHLRTKEALLAAALNYLSDACAPAVADGLAEGMNAAELGRLPAVQTYVRALARCLSEDSTLLTGQTRYPVLHQLAAAGEQLGLDPATANARAVTYVAAVFGAELFAPYFASALELDPSDVDRVLTHLDHALIHFDNSLLDDQSAAPTREQPLL